MKKENSLTPEQLEENDKKELARLRKIENPCSEIISKIERIKIRLKIATLITGKEVDLEKLRNYEKHSVERHNVSFFDKEDELITTVPLSTLIDCWIDKEEADFREAMK